MSNTDEFHWKRTLSRSLNLRIPSIALLALLLLIGTVEISDARFEGQLDIDLALTPQEEKLLHGDSVTKVKFDYIDGKIKDYPSVLSKVLFWPHTTLADTGSALSGEIILPMNDLHEPNLFLDGYYAREFGPDYPIGTLGGSSRLYFKEENLKYWLTKGIINYGGFSYGLTFLLEDSPDKLNRYGSGYELSISGTKISGVGVTLKSWVGMIPDYTELIPAKLGVNNQSGYDTFNTIGQDYEGYTGSEVTFQGISFGPLVIDSTTTFSFLKGFQNTIIEFTAEEEGSLLTVEGELTLAPDSKKISLKPTLQLEWSCIEVYAAILPQVLSNQKDALTGITVYGFGVDELLIGSLEYTARLGIGNNHLYRRIDQPDYELRAGDYIFSPPTKQVYYYKETPYDSVITLEGGSGNLYLAVDGYWGGSADIFGLGLVTGEMEYKFSQWFEIESGLRISPEGGLEKIILNTTYSW